MTHIKDRPIVDILLISRQAIIQRTSPRTIITPSHIFKTTSLVRFGPGMWVSLWQAATRIAQ